MTAISATAGARAHEAMFQAAKAFFDGEPTMVMRYPGRITFGDQLVAMGNIDSNQDHARFPRGRDETLLIDMYFTAAVGGDPDEADLDARDRAFDMLDRFADHVRRNATELDGNVEWCFLEHYSTESMPAAKGGGITWEITATFKLFYQVRG